MTRGRSALLESPIIKITQAEERKQVGKSESPPFVSVLNPLVRTTPSSNQNDPRCRGEAMRRLAGHTLVRKGNGIKVLSGVRRSTS